MTRPIRRADRTSAHRAELTVRRHPIAPFDQLTITPSEWRGALVMVEDGEVDLVSAAGAVATVAAGDVLWLDPSPVRLVRNRRARPAIVVAIGRSGITKI